MVDDGWENVKVSTENGRIITRSFNNSGKLIEKRNLGLSMDVDDLIGL